MDQGGDAALEIVMATEKHSRRILYTGPIWAGVHTTVKALDLGTPFCEEEMSCPHHRAYGKHLAVDLDNYVEEIDVTVARHGRSCDVEIKVGQQKGSGAGLITDLFDLQPMTRKEFEWLHCCDAIVFVVNPKASGIQTGLDWMVALREDLVAAGRDPDRIPLVFQLNKRDLPVGDPDPDRCALPVETLKKLFQWPGCRYAEAIARQRIGVFEALEDVIDLYEHT